MATPTSLDDILAYLAVADAEAAAAALATELVPDLSQVGGVVVGLCWATVDLERTVGDVAAPFVPAKRDRILGGVPAVAHLGPIAVIVEEPSTEGRLAASLARFGEGLCAVYVTPASGTTASRLRPGATPLGIEATLLPHEWPWGPFVLVTAAAPRSNQASGSLG